MSDTIGQTPAIPDETVELRTVALTLCVRCLAGSGGECHSPGCALWMNRAPDLVVEPLAGRTVVETPEPAKYGVNTATWLVPAHVEGTPPTHVEATLYEDHGPVITVRQARTLVVMFRPDEAYGVIAALAAATVHAEQLAAESGQDGDSDG